jgi:Molecular chaperone
MQKEAEAHAADDAKAKEGVEARNNADSLAYQCEKQLKDLGEKVPGNLKQEVEDLVAKVREALKGSDSEAIKSSAGALQAKFQEVSSELYKQASAQQAPPRPEDDAAGPGPTATNDGGAKKPGDVVDAEFEMVDEEKKP